MNFFSKLFYLWRRFFKSIQLFSSSPAPASS